LQAQVVEGALPAGDLCWQKDIPPDWQQWQTGPPVQQHRWPAAGLAAPAAGTLHRQGTAKAGWTAIAIANRQDSVFGSPTGKYIIARLVIGRQTHRPLSTYLLYSLIWASPRRKFP
jgi:hypothetical protein